MKPFLLPYFVCPETGTGRAATGRDLNDDTQWIAAFGQVCCTPLTASAIGALTRWGRAGFPAIVQRRR